VCKANTKHRLAQDLAHQQIMGHIVLSAMSRTTQKELYGMTAPLSISSLRIRAQHRDTKQHELQLGVCRLYRRHYHPVFYVEPILKYSVLYGRMTASNYISALNLSISRLN
jgi:hypothetical protein